MKIALFILFFCVFTKIQAQFFDSISLALKGKYSIDARYESRNSFIDNKLTTVSGLRLGLAFKQKLRIGAGVQWLSSNITRTIFQKNEINSTDTIQQFLKWAYVCVYTDVVFYKTKRWQLSVPIQIGLGESWWQNSKPYVFKKEQAKYFVFVYEPGITAQFKVFKWLGLGADLAYRFCIKNNKNVNSRLSGPTYSFKILFWADQLFYQLFPEHKITKRFGPSYW